MMLMSEYQRQAMRSASLPTMESRQAMLLTAVLGLSGETGEIADHVKKFLYHGHEFSPGEMVKELGDVLWYCALLAEYLLTDLDQVASLNIQKLKARYPEGFTKERSVNRGNDNV